jgi:predicted DNA-binding helix-hairpin-helix protein
MARLSAARRRKLPKSSFALKGKRKYPIDTKARARNALARVAQHGTASEKKRVRAAVHRRYPSIGRSTKSRRRR